MGHGPVLELQLEVMPGEEPSKRESHTGSPRSETRRARISVTVSMSSAGSIAAGKGERGSVTRRPGLFRFLQGQPPHPRELPFSTKALRKWPTGQLVGSGGHSATYPLLLSCPPPSPRFPWHSSPPPCGWGMFGPALPAPPPVQLLHLSL